MKKNKTSTTTKTAAQNALFGAAARNATDLHVLDLVPVYFVARDRKGTP